jgi:putative DNA primase/helicase
VSPCLDAALAYTGQLQWPVFALHPICEGRCTCGNPACDNAGKHPITTGWERSIASVGAVRATWAPRLGTRGIGLPCGRIDVFALDIDPRHRAHVELRDLLHGERLPATVVAATGGGGWHYIFRQPEFRVRNWSLGPDSALHTRGDGGFIVLPPSPHRSGVAYRWLRSPFDHEIAPAPAWLIARLRDRTKGKKILAGDDGYQIPAGQRHHHMIRFAGLLRSCGCNEATVVACGLDFLRLQCQQEPAMDFALAEDQLRKAARNWAGTYTPREAR